MTPDQLRSSRVRALQARGVFLAPDGRAIELVCRDEVLAVLRDTTSPPDDEPRCQCGARRAEHGPQGIWHPFEPAQATPVELALLHALDAWACDHRNRAVTMAAWSAYSDMHRKIAELLNPELATATPEPAP